jgi:FtsP/CotA-like multicopper oxidase with cupredoxin domain
MTGMLLISDEEEDAAQLPAGAQDLALVIQDRSFDGSNQLVYLNNVRHNWMMGFAGERVQVLMAFENHAGLYLYHCHILEHEDLGMMRNYLIET